MWGISPQGATSKKAFREKFGLPFTLLADEAHEVAEAYGSWVEKQNYGKTYWGTARTDVPGGPGGPHRPDVAEGQARGPRRRGARRRSTTLQAARGGDGRRDAPDTKETSLVGGDERSLGRKGTAETGAAQDVDARSGAARRPSCRAVR